MKFFQKRILLLAEKLSYQANINDLRMFTVVIGRIPYQINIFRQKTPNSMRSEVWFLSDDAILAVINGHIDARSNSKEFKNLIYILENSTYFRELMDRSGILVTDREAEQWVLESMERDRKQNRVYTFYRLIEMRNDYKLLFEHFGDDKYLNRVRRIESLFVELSLNDKKRP